MKARGARRILICDPIHEAGLALLHEAARVDQLDGSAELAERVGDYDGVVVRSRTQLRGPELERAGRLRVIGRVGSGLDNIDVKAAEARGIAVVSAPDASAVSVAEHALALMLALARQIPEANRAMKRAQWAKSALAGVALSGKALGIVGFGRIGRELARRAAAFEMRRLVADHNLTPEEAQRWQVERRTFVELLPDVDFLSLHIPYRPENEGLIGAEALARMKPTAYLINTSRGRLVDEAALLAALEEGRLAGAGLDVFRNEPEINWKLAGHPGVIATPHIAASTDDAQRRAAVAVAEQVLAVLDL